jgi:hypothetical protein
VKRGIKPHPVKTNKIVSARRAFLIPVIFI